VIASGFGPVTMCDDIASAQASVSGRTYAVIGADRASDPGFAALVAALRASGGDLLLCGEIGPPEVVAIVRDHAVDHIITTDPVASADEVPLTLRTLVARRALDQAGVMRYLGHDTHLVELSPDSTHARVVALNSIRDGLTAMGVSARHERH